MQIKRVLICGIILMSILAASSSSHAGYKSVLNRWTKSGRSFAFETLDARLIWNATLLSGEMVSAQRALLKKKKMDIKAAEPKGVDFFISFFTHKNLNQFSLDDSSTWKIFLVGADGTEIPPSRIETITITPTETEFYPYLNRWSKAYRVSFPKTDLGKRPQLILRSIVAESRLKWKVK